MDEASLAPDEDREMQPLLRCSLLSHLGISTPLCEGELMICDGFSFSLSASPRIESAIFVPCRDRSSIAESVVSMFLLTLGSSSTNLSIRLPVPFRTGYFSSAKREGGALSAL